MWWLQQEKKACQETALQDQVVTKDSLLTVEQHSAVIGEDRRCECEKVCFARGLHIPLPNRCFDLLTACISVRPSTDLIFPLHLIVSLFWPFLPHLFRKAALWRKSRILQHMQILKNYGGIFSDTLAMPKRYPRDTPILLQTPRGTSVLVHR